MANEIVLSDGEVIEPKNVPGMLAEIVRSEALQRVETARQYRRSVDHFMKTTLSMLNYSPAMAAKFRYKLPKKGQDGQPIQGVSIMGAKLLASAWGNLDFEGSIIAQDDRFVTAQGKCTDLESNVTFRTTVKVPIRTSGGRMFSDDMIKNACGAAESKAIRNAILGVIPPMFVGVIEEEAIRLTRGDAKSLPDRVGRALQWFAGRGIEEDRVLATLSVVGRNDVTLDQLVTLQGFKAAIEDGEPVDKVFVRLDVDAEVGDDRRRGSRAAELAERLTPRGGGRRTPTADETIDLGRQSTEMLGRLARDAITPGWRENLNEPSDVRIPEPEVVEPPAEREPGEDG